jgi:F0F1-type ATP synthase assembly protein I
MPPSQPSKRPGQWARQVALATELPVILVGTVLVGGALGYFLDRWLKTTPILMLVLGTAGLVVGVRDLLRRLKKEDSDGEHNSKS